MNMFTSVGVGIKDTFIQTVSRSLGKEYVINQSVYLTLCSLAGILLLVAALGYLTGGYAWGFYSINSLSKYVSPIFLHNMTTFGDGIFLFSLIINISL